jgi:hypothetical protein
LKILQDGVFLFLKVHPRIFFLNEIQTFLGWEGILSEMMMVFMSFIVPSLNGLAAGT